MAPVVNLGTTTFNGSEPNCTPLSTVPGLLMAEAAMLKAPTDAMLMAGDSWLSEGFVKLNLTTYCANDSTLLPSSAQTYSRSPKSLAFQAPKLLSSPETPPALQNFAMLLPPETDTSIGTSAP